MHKINLLGMHTSWSPTQWLWRQNCWQTDRQPAPRELPGVQTAAEAEASSAYILQQSTTQNKHSIRGMKHFNILPYCTLWIRPQMCYTSVVDYLHALNIYSICLHSIQEWYGGRYIYIYIYTCIYIYIYIYISYMFPIFTKPVGSCSLWKASFRPLKLEIHYWPHWTFLH